MAEISGSTRPHVLSAQAYGMSVGRMMIAARRAISDTERRFPVRIRVGVPPRGLGDRLDQIQTWLDANCGADGWAMAPAGLRGPLNDAIAVYFNDATLAAAFLPDGAPAIGPRAPTASSRSARMSRRRAYRLASIRRLENGAIVRAGAPDSLRKREATPPRLRKYALLAEGAV